jgi:trehalose monomycolate/heme transporter
MFEAWGRTAYRFRRLIVVLGLIFFAGTSFYGPLVFGALQSGGGFNAPNSQSTTADNLAATAFGRDTADVVVLYRMHGVPVSDPRFKAAVTSSLDALPRTDVTAERTYWTTHSPAMVSADGKSTYAVLSLAGSTTKARQNVYDSIKGELTPPGLTALVSGQVPTNEAINKEVTADISKAEGFSLPVLLILLVFIFGSLAAASLPLLIGGMGILGGFAVLHVLTLFTDVAAYALNITTILGLGLAIDYGLFMVMRFRSELAAQQREQADPASQADPAGQAGRPSSAAVSKALTRTMATAGRTVAVSGLTVTLALIGMTLFPETFLRSMGFGGVATVLVDMVLALTVLPALLALMGHRVNSLSVTPLLRRLHLVRPVRAGERRSGNGFWGSVGNGVTRRPAIYALVIVAGLIVLALPFRNISWGGIDARDLPASSQEAQVTVALQNQFPANATTPITVIMRLPGPVATQQAAIGGYESRLSAVSGVSSVHVTGASGDTAELSAQFPDSTLSPQARALVAQVRNVTAPPGATVYVGGATADLVDELANLGSVLPWMLLVMGLSTFVLLFLAFGSLLVPIKAIVANLLTLGATFGVVTWIFQYGHLHGLLGFTPTGTIEPSMPILMLAITFGLSMDYEVFLVSRMREQYDLTGDTRQSIVEGLKRTGPIITSAALLLIIVIGSFSASGITFIKLVGVGMFIAILLDATIVRAVLVPAVMTLLGRAAWWTPGPLKRLYARYGVAERDLPRTEPAESAESAGSGEPVVQRRV